MPRCLVAELQLTGPGFLESLGYLGFGVGG